jgi:pyruvate dehydrogenase E1 component alpha subunit
MTATGVVGGNIPLALGAAYARRLAGSDAVALAFFGDGAGQTGSFHESLNIASLWGLPLVLVCENNGYAEFTPLSAHTRIERLSTHADTYGIPTETVDGNDVFAVRDAVRTAVAGARSGSPRFVEALTYRLRGHYEGDPAKYRELSELSDWRAKDPIAIAQARLQAEGVVDGDTVDRLEREARTRVEAAAATALAAPLPGTDDVISDVYAA